MTAKRMEAKKREEERKKRDEVEVGKIDLDQGADDDDYHITVTGHKRKEPETVQPSVPQASKKKKVVRF